MGGSQTSSLRLSVVCPVYNTSPDLLHAATRSVLIAADHHLHELILVDDVSTNPDTLRAIEQIASEDRRVVVVRQRRNLGQFAARNRGIQQATGDWIGFIDHDDLWVTGRMEAVLSVLGAFPHAGWIAGNYHYLYRDGTTKAAPVLSESCPATYLQDEVFRLRSPDLTRYLIGAGSLHLGTSVIRRNLIEDTSSRYDGVIYFEDAIFFTRLSIVADCYFIHQDVYAWRRASTTLMSSPRRLGCARADGWKRARSDELLHPFRREIRWTLYSLHKSLAVDNLLNHRPIPALLFALRAWLFDPREIGQLALFLRLMLGADCASDPAAWRRYSAAEHLIVDRTALK